VISRAAVISTLACRRCGASSGEKSRPSADIKRIIVSPHGINPIRHCQRFEAIGIFKLGIHKNQNLREVQGL